MNWTDENWLKLLIVPGAGALLLLAMKIVRRREGAVRWPGIRRVIAAGSRVLSVPASRSVRRPWLLLLACAVVVVALARPRWGEIEKPVVQQAREVMIALDLSRSMLVQDVAPDRLSRARLLVRSLLEGLRGERVGLIVFAGTAFVQVPLSADYQILEEFLPELNPGYMPQGGTDYSGMLRAATGGFSETRDTDRYLIVLSDGEALDDSWRTQLPELARRGVRAITLGVGTAAGGFIPEGDAGFLKDERGAVVLSRLEPETLRALASETRGVYRDASSWVDLARLLQDTIAQGRRGEFTEERTVDYIERYQWFLAPALLLAALGIWREIGVRPRARNVVAQSAPRPRRSASASAAVVSVGRALLLLLVPVSLHWTTTAALAAAQPASPPPPASPEELVRTTIGRLVAAATPRAADWHELAQRTLDYGRGAREAGAPVESGVVTDALAAVSLGEKADPLLTDWPQLRSELEALLQKPPEQNQPEQDQEQKDDEKEKENQEQKQDSPSGGEQPQQNEPQDQQQQQQQPESSSEQKPSESPQDNQSQSEPQPQQDQSSSEGQSQSEPKAPRQQAPQEGKMGDLKDEEKQPSPQPQEQPPASEPPPQPRTRKIGGQPAEQDKAPLDPEMAAALQRLRQATDRDSPARLFELLEGEPEKTKRGKDW